MRFVAYLRISSYSQREKGDSIDGQREYIQRWAKSNGHEIVHWYVDEAASAFKGRRFVFDVMLHELSEQIIDANGVVVYSLSRFSRNLKNQLLAMEVLEKKGMILQSASEALPSEPSSFKFMTNILGILHEHQSRENAAVVSDRLRDTARKGFHTGGPLLFGYQSVSVKGDTSKERKKLVVKSDEAEVVKEIYSLSDIGLNGKGLGVKEIAKILNDKKITNRGKRWNKNTIHRILTNSAYKGEFEFGKTKKNEPGKNIIKIPVPKIVSKELYNRVQNKLSQRQVAYNNVKSLRSSSLLTGTLRCPVCGSTMVISTGKGGKYKYYQCSLQVRQDPKLCSSKRLRKNEADNALRKALLEHVFTYKHLASIYNDTLEIVKNKKKVSDEKLRPIRNQISSLKTKVRNLVDLIADGKIEPNPAINRNMDEYNAQIALYEEKLDSYKSLASIPIKRFGKAQISSFVDNVQQYVKEANDEKLKQFLLATITEVTITEQKKLVLKGSNLTLLYLISNEKVGTDYSVPTFVTIWRRDRDLNPRYAINVCRFSRPVLSTTQPSLRCGTYNREWNSRCKALNYN